VYQIATTCPLLYDPLGFPGTMQYLQHGASIYFDSPAVKRAINAPQIPWSSASPRKIYNTTLGLSTNDSNGEFTGLKVLPRVIEKSKRTLIGHSELGYILLKAGTLLTIQNMTWNGMQGFQQPIEDDFYVPYHDDYELGALAGAGIVGKARTERGLTFFSVTGAGHMGTSALDLEVCKHAWLVN
jgi:carboxypeptidase D